MKKLLTCLLLLLAQLSARQYAQAQFADSKLDSLYDAADFSVPDLPAFKALGIEHTKMLTPSTIRDLAFSFTPFYTGSGVTLPQNFALELAPAKLDNAFNTLHNYNHNAGKRWLLNTSISIGTHRDSLQQTQLALGYRSTFIHAQHDLRRRLFKLSALNQPGRLTAAMTNIEAALAQKYNLRNLDNPSAPTYAQERSEYANYVRHIDSIVKTDAALNAQIQFDVATIKDILGGPKGFDFSKLTDDEIFGVFETYKEKIASKAIKEFEDEYWNATRLDIAFAYTALSRDSAVEGARFNAFDAWVTGSVRLGKWGQWMLGVNGRIPYSQTGFAYDATISSRLFAGVNKYKGILEAQYRAADFGTVSQSLTISAGAEFRLAGSLWVVALTGYQSGISGSFRDQFVSNLNLKYGLN